MAGATSFIIRPLPEITESIPHIVRGVAGKGYSDWSTTSDGGSRIFTYTEIAVEEVLRGEITGTSILARELGGEKDGQRMEVPGTSKFHVGEKVVLLLADPVPEDRGAYPIASLMLGKYHLSRNPDGSEVLTEGVFLAAEQGRGVHDDEAERQDATGLGHRNGHSDTKKPWTFEAFRKMVKGQKYVSNTEKLQASKQLLSKPSREPPSGPPQAPPLQNKDAAGVPGASLEPSTSFPSWIWAVAGLIVLGLLFIFWGMGTSRKA